MSRAEKVKLWALWLKERGEPNEPECSIRLWMAMNSVAKELGIDLSMARVMYDPLYQTFMIFKVMWRLMV